MSTGLKLPVSRERGQEANGQRDEESRGLEQLRALLNLAIPVVRPLSTIPNKGPRGSSCLTTLLGDRRDTAFQDSAALCSSLSGGEVCKGRKTASPQSTSRETLWFESQVELI